MSKPCSSAAAAMSKPARYMRDMVGGSRPGRMKLKRIKVMTMGSNARPSRDTPSLQLRQHQRAGRDRGASRDEGMVDPIDLVDRCPPHLADRFGDAVHAVDVGLAELAAVGVDWQPAADLDVAVGDEVLGLAPGAEAELLQLRQDQRGEVVVDHRGLDILRAEPRGVPPPAGAGGPLLGVANR